MPNMFFFYLPLLQIMALQLFACASFSGVSHTHRRNVVPFSLYLLLLSFGVVGTVLTSLPHLELFAIVMRFFCMLAGFLCLLEFSLRFFRISLIRRILAETGLLLLSCLILICFEYEERGEVLALFLPGIPALILGSTALWKLGGKFREQENVFRIAAIATGGTGFSIVGEMFLVLRLLPIIARLDLEFHLALMSFSLVCTLIGSVAFLTMLKDIRLQVGRHTISGAWIVIVIFLIFAFAAAVIPLMMRRHAEKIASRHVDYSAGLLVRDLEVSANRMKEYVRELAGRKELADAMKNGVPNRTTLGKNNFLEKYTTAHQRAILYFTDAQGVCLDSSLKSSSRVRMVGQNISYSPHCREAMKRGESCLISVGSITGVPSIFAARRIDDVDGKPLGVLCAREDFGFMFTKFADVYVALLSPDNMVFMTNEKHFSAHTPFWARERKGIRENAEQLNGCYLDGILYAERACNFLTVPGWRVVLGLPTQLPLWAYIAGEILVVLLWLLPLMIFSLFVLHYRMRHGFAVSLNWRKTVFNNNASGIFVTDSQCRLADSNRTFSLFSGYTVEELRKMKLFDLCPNTGSEKEELSDFVFSSRAHYENFEFRICRKNGVLTTVFLAGNRIHTARMNPHLPSDGVIWTVTDLSAPMDELDRLRKEEERFRALVENSTEQVALLDPQGTILYSNDREIAFLLRKSPTPVHLSELYDPATTSLFLKMIQNVISSRRPLTFRYTRKTPGTPEEEMLSLFFPIPREGAVQQIGVVTRKFESEPGNPEKH